MSPITKTFIKTDRTLIRWKNNQVIVPINKNLQNTLHQLPLTYSLLANKACHPFLLSEIKTNEARPNHTKKIRPGIKKKMVPPVIINPDKKEIQKYEIILPHPRRYDS